jgi:hypothetical protein
MLTQKYLQLLRKLEKSEDGDLDEILDKMDSIWNALTDKEAKELDAYIRRMVSGSEDILEDAEDGE